MSDEHLKEIRNLMAEFGELSLNNFRDAFLPLVRDKNPTIDRYLVEELKNFRGNRAMRAVIANALAEREDESYLEDFSSVIEKETDVSLCKECINALTRIGSQEAVQKLEFLVKTKPNATISGLLRQELEKIRHEEKEPAAYYLDQLSKGNQNPRNCIHASKVMIKMGDRKVVDEIVKRFNDYDDLARTEGVKVVARLGEGRHLEPMLDLLDRYKGTYQDNETFLETIEGYAQSPKEERLGQLRGLVKRLATNDQEALLDRFLQALEANNMTAAGSIRDDLLQIAQPVGLDYLLESLIQISDNKIAHANKFHEEYLRAGRVRHSRLRHLVAEAGYGIGRIAHQWQGDDAVRMRAVDRMIALVKSSDNDVSRQALYGVSFFVRPDDVELLDATLETHQVEGMTRLLRTLERRPSGQFTDFFLKVSLKHEILDIQEMAMQALGDTPEVHEKVRLMLESDNPEIKRTAIRIIGEIRCAEFKPDLLKLLEGQSDIIRIQSITTLGKLGHSDVLDAVNTVMYDAKSQVLVEICLKAIAQIGTEKGVKLLHQFAEKARVRKTAMVAIELLVEAYKSWSNPLPTESNETVVNQLKSWFEDKDGPVRIDAYRIASLIITLDLNVYNTLKNMFKDASSRLRAQATWDKNEMAMTEEALRVVNRNFFFLKEMQNFQSELSNRCRNHDHPSSTTRMGVFEKMLSHLEANEKFLLSAANEQELEKVVLKGLELEGGSWREQNILFKIASFTNSDVLRTELLDRLKTVVKQAKAELMDALTRMGYGLAQINALSGIQKVLVLDGSGFMRKKMVAHLQAKGLEVRECGDVEVGWAMVQSQVPDLVITEVTFGEGAEGADFVERLTKEYKTRIQFIFSTNVRDQALLDRVTRIKPLAVFHKPFPLEKLDEFLT